MELHPHLSWVEVGHASAAGGSLRLLEREMLFFSKCGNVENDHFLLNVVYLERKKIVVLRIAREQ
jgi:hypothetical protein